MLHGKGNDEYEHSIITFSSTSDSLFNFSAVKEEPGVAGA